MGRNGKQKFKKKHSYPCFRKMFVRYNQMQKINMNYISYKILAVLKV